MAQIQPIDLTHIARLSRLKLSEDEEKKFTQEIGDILNYVDELNQTDTLKVLAVSQISGLVNVVRPDAVANGEDRENLLQNAPEQKDGAIKVKQVFE